MYSLYPFQYYKNLWAKRFKFLSYACVCLHVHVYICLHVQCCGIDFTESRMYMCMYIYMCTYTYVYIQMCIRMFQMTQWICWLIISRSLVTSRVVLMILITSSLNYWALQMLIRWVWLLWLYHVIAMHRIF